MFRAPGVAAGGEDEDGVDRGLKRTGVLLDLGEQQATLEDSEQGYGVVVSVDACRQAADGLEPSRPFADGG